MLVQADAKAVAAFSKSLTSLGDVYVNDAFGELLICDLHAQPTFTLSPHPYPLPPPHPHAHPSP